MEQIERSIIMYVDLLSGDNCHIGRNGPRVHGALLTISDSMLVYLISSVGSLTPASVFYLMSHSIFSV